MKNKKGTIILSIILIVQFIIPLGIWGYETYKNKELEEKGQEVKVLIDRANYNENRVEFHIIKEDEFLYTNEDFIVFVKDENGFSTLKATATVSETDLYVSENKLYNWYNQDWCFKFKTETTKAQDKYDYFDLYDLEIEKVNINNGFCSGPETQAYAVFKVYKNRFKVVNVYIDGIPVETVIEKYNSNELDLSRYEYQYEYSDEYYEIDDYYDEVEEYYGEAAIDDSYVTEPVAA